MSFTLSPVKEGAWCESLGGPANSNSSFLQCSRALAAGMIRNPVVPCHLRAQQGVKLIAFHQLQGAFTMGEVWCVWTRLWFSHWLL